MTAMRAMDQSRIEPGGGLNRQVAERLREAAELLEQQQANPFRAVRGREVECLAQADPGTASD